MLVPTSPPSRPVRGRTRPGRLAALDAWLVHEEAALLRQGGVVADLGFGASPATVLDLAAALAPLGAGLEVVGLEQDPSRVPPSPPGVTLLVGGVDRLAALGPCQVVRVMNVLRGYPREQAAGVTEALGAALGEGGLLLEGSTDLTGAVTACHRWRRRGGGLAHQGLLLHTDGSRGYSPWLFRDVLPRDLRREVRPGTWLHACFTAWEGRLAAGARGRSPQERLVASLEGAPELQASPWERAHGFLRLRLPVAPA